MVNGIVLEVYVLIKQEPLLRVTHYKLMIAQWILVQVFVVLQEVEPQVNHPLIHLIIMYIHLY